MDLPGWLSGNNPEKQQIAAEKRERDWQEQQQSRKIGAQPADDPTFFSMKDLEANNTRWLNDLSSENAQFFTELLGLRQDEDGNYVQTTRPLCSQEFVNMLKPLITVGTSKTHSHTNYGDNRYAKRVRNIYHSVVDLMVETWETNGIDTNPASYSFLLEQIKTHVNNVAQRAIDDKERMHERKIYKENTVRTQSIGGQPPKGLGKYVENM